MPEKTRTTFDLICELEIEAAHYSTVALAVGFEHKTLFVFSGADDNLTKLSDMINEGGKPIGFLMFQLDGERHATSITCRPLEECVAEPWGARLLGRLDPQHGESSRSLDQFDRGLATRDSEWVRWRVSGFC